MNRRKPILIILIIILVLGMTGGKVLSEESQPYRQSNATHQVSPKKVVDQFFSERKGINGFQGKLQISQIRETFKDEANLEELINRFNADCRKLDKPTNNTKTTSAFPCSQAVMTLGVLGGANTKELILRYLQENNNSNPFATKAGLLALGYLDNTQEQKRREGILPERSSPPSGLGIHSLHQVTTLNVPQEIIKCLPPSLRSKFQVLSDQLTLCESPWDVSKLSDRDKIRWGLISLAETGSDEAKKILEGLKSEGREGTSRQGFIQELIKLHTKASQKNGLLCVNEPENPVCQ